MKEVELLIEVALSIEEVANLEIAVLLMEASPLTEEAAPLTEVAPLMGVGH